MCITVWSKVMVWTFETLGSYTYFWTMWNYSVYFTVVYRQDIILLVLQSLFILLKGEGDTILVYKI